MIYLNAFLFSAFVCAIGQLVLENTKLSSGDLNTSLVILGVFLSCIGVYDKILKFAGGGATILITNFGHSVFQSAFEGFQKSGIFGLLNGLLSPCLCLSVAVISAFFAVIFFKSKH